MKKCKVRVITGILIVFVLLVANIIVSGSERDNQQLGKSLSDNVFADVIKPLNTRLDESSIKSKDLVKCVSSQMTLEEVLETRDKTVNYLTGQIGPMYNLNPKLLQSIIYYESSNNPNAVNHITGCCGYMQIAEPWHTERMISLGVDDIYDPYGNILVGTDYLSELLNKYNDLSLCLMIYNGDERSFDLYNNNQRSEYANNVITLFNELKSSVGI